MPSSLAVIHSSTLGFSPHPPVSVYGTGRRPLYASSLFLQDLTYTIRSSEDSRYCPASLILSYSVQRGFPSPRGSVISRSRLSLADGQRNINRFVIACPFRVRLSPRLNPGRLTWPGNPWVFGAGGSTPVIVTHAYIFLSDRSSIPRKIPSTLVTMLPYHSDQSESQASAAVLMPAHHPRIIARLVSCYALFE